MRSRRIAIQTSALGIPIKRALEAAARLGATAVELDARSEVRAGELSQTGRRQFRKLLEDLDLRVSALRFRTRRGYDVTDDLDRRIEATKEAMQLAYSLGANLVVNQVGQVPQESSGAWPVLVESLRDLAAYADRAGAVLAAETGTESGADLDRLLEAVGAGGVAVTFNPGNLIVHGFSATEAIAALGRRVAYVHAKDGVRDLAIGRGTEVPLGRGVADFPALVGTLEEFGYRGYFCVERENSRDPMGDVGAAVEYLQNLLAGG